MKPDLVINTNEISMKPIKKNLSQVFILILTTLILFVTGCKKDEESGQEKKERITQELNDQINADTLNSIVVWLENMGTRFALADNHRNVALKIRKRFISMGYENTRIDSFMINKTYLDINYQQWQYNVVATLEGESYPDSLCIIGGHYDNNLRSGDTFLTVPGANDNASGVAGVMEIARVMKKNNYVPSSTIEFVAFGSEELGLFGSYAYAGDARQDSKQIRFMLNNDMIAYQPGTDKSQWIVNIMDYDNSHNIRILAERLCTRFTVLKYTNDNRYNKQSDSYPFFINGYKPLFFFSKTVDPNFHSTSDLASNCNFEYCREIVKLCCAVLVDKN
jgi:hypothetical protein